MPQDSSEEAPPKTGEQMTQDERLAQQVKVAAQAPTKSPQRRYERASEAREPVVAVVETLNVIVTRVEQMARVLEDEYHAVQVVLKEVQITAKVMQQVIGDADELQELQRQTTERLGAATAALLEAVQRLEEMESNRLV